MQSTLPSTSPRHFRFADRIPAHDRSRAIRSLAALGVVRMPPAFPDSDHPARSRAYQVIAPKTAVWEAIDEYIQSDPVLVPLSEVALQELAIAPYPVITRAPARNED